MDAQTFLIRAGEAVGAEIRAEAAAQRITIKTLAERVPMDRSTLVRYLDGTRQMPITSLFQVSRVLGLPASQILKRAEARVGTEDDPYGHLPMIDPDVLGLAAKRGVSRGRQLREAQDEAAYQAAIGPDADDIDLP